VDGLDRTSTTVSICNMKREIEISLNITHPTANDFSSFTVGNIRFRELITEKIPNYLAARTKTEKSQVIIDIVEKLRRDSPSGVGLAKLNTKTGRWSFIGNDKAKDKIGHALRKASQEKRSSSEDSTSGERKRKEPTEEEVSSDEQAPQRSTLSARCRKEAELYSNSQHWPYGNASNKAYENYIHHAPSYPSHQHYYVVEYIKHHPPPSVYTHGSYHVYPPPLRVIPYHSHTWDNGMASQYREPSSINEPPSQHMYSPTMS
jgi:hypothetical protein